MTRDRRTQRKGASHGQRNCSCYVDRGHVNDIVEKLVELDGVFEVFSVACRYDLAAILRSSTNERIAQLVTRHIMDMEHITYTETLMAFQAYSKYDLEAMFSIGLE